mmetsp:Transcript_6281/g.3521  ORF Transcript_6281/g.3521 Transcript_6281/m.3521 type:complete len:219 (+) Transcript_6281:1486-2142(+)
MTKFNHSHGTMNKKTAQHRFYKAYGFTLLELLVAMAVFAVLSVVAYSGLSIVLNSQKKTEQHARRLAEIQKALTFIERDLIQMAPREIRDEYGDRQPVLIVNEEENEIKMEFTRTGRPNVHNVVKGKYSSLQRVAYEVKEKQLIRANWIVLDRAQDSSRFENLLLNDIIRFFIECWDGDSWVEKWPSEELPRAVKIKIELEDFGTIFRVVHVAYGQRV